jgi:hypothetical protein
MADKIRFVCVCGKTVAAPAEYAGRSAVCPACGQKIKIPSPPQTATQPPSVPAMDPMASAKEFPPQPSFPPLPSAAAATPMAQQAIEADVQSTIWDELSDDKMQPHGDSVGGFNPITPTATLPSLASGTSSLAQSARRKQLNVARGIMFGVGILTIVVNLAQLAMVDNEIDKQLDQEAAKLVQQGRMIDQVKFAEIKQAAKRVGHLIMYGVIGLGALYIVFGLLIWKFPVPITIIALTIYVGSAVVFAALSNEPLEETLLKGIIVKVIIVVALVKAVQAAIAYQKAGAV